MRSSTTGNAGADGLRPVATWMLNAPVEVVSPSPSVSWTVALIVSSIVVEFTPTVARLSLIEPPCSNASIQAILKPAGAVIVSDVGLLAPNRTKLCVVPLV